MDKEKLAQLFDLRADAAPMLVAEAFGITAAVDHIERQIAGNVNDLELYQRAIAEELLEAMLNGDPQPQKTVVDGLMSSRLGLAAIEMIGQQIPPYGPHLDNRDSRSLAEARLALWADRIRAPKPRAINAEMAKGSEAREQEQVGSDGANSEASPEGFVAMVARVRRQHFGYMGRREASVAGVGTLVGILFSFVMFPSGAEDVRAQLAVPSEALSQASIKVQAAPEPTDAGSINNDSVPPERLLIAIARVEQENKNGMKPEGKSDMDRVLDHLIEMERADLEAAGVLPNQAVEPEPQGASDPQDENAESEGKG